MATYDARGTLDEARGAALTTRQAIELSATRQRAAEQSLENSERRRDRLRAEGEQLQAPPEGQLEAMREAGARVLALDAGRTLVIDRQAFLLRAEADGVAVLGLDPVRAEAPKP